MVESKGTDSADRRVMCQQRSCKLPQPPVARYKALPNAPAPVPGIVNTSFAPRQGPVQAKGQGLLSHSAVIQGNQWKGRAS